MIVRGLTGIALAASLLHLNLIRADVACGEHDRAPIELQAQDHSAHHAAPPQPHEGHGAEGDEACDTPRQMDCCQALTSCSPGLGDGCEALIASIVPTHETAIRTPVDIPLSRVTTPDPPPPRV